MPKSATAQAREVLARQLFDAGAIHTFHIHDFTDDEETRDDEAFERLSANASADFDQIEAVMTEQYGKPSHTGTADDDAIPMKGIFRFTVWAVGGKQMFVAAAQDRGEQILLIAGPALWPCSDGDDR